MKNFKITPVILFLGTFLLGVGLKFLVELRVSYLFSLEAGNLIGVIFLFIALFINILVYKSFQNHNTSHEPFSRPSSLIKKGLFSFSRNPLYIALIISEIALGFICDNAFLLGVAFLLFLTLDLLVVRDEEQILLEVFGKEYENYCKKTPRWFFPALYQK